MSVTIDPTLRVKPSKALLSYLESATADTDEGSEAPSGLRNLDSDSEIDLCDIRWVFDQRTGVSSPRFHELLAGCELVLPVPKLPPRNPELEARVQRLRKEQEDREYRKMVGNIDSSNMNPWKRKQEEEESIGKQSEWKEREN